MQYKFKVTILVLCNLALFSFFTPSAHAIGLDIKKSVDLEDQNKPLIPLTVTELIVRPKVVYDSADLRDPLKPLIVEESGSGRGYQDIEAQPPVLTIQGIIWGGRFPQAIINRKVVKIGDTLEGVRIIDISKEGVTIFFEGKQYKLSSPAAGAAAPAEKPQGGQDEKVF